ncbi:MAG: T9SS type A sorting domain-containing protein [Candidatus Marinimicrobia bacterium]|nr:T9SS type A sorting domain-containing protein [Candidatus Neomarinimicrobiota bacterium]MBT3936257.1 T9SS type A sorting domain-containing protein [Candidatus Neomarinimicrobiota bacterium]MBT3960577.1 T9SS type A sorting domain-containing protein [Candidatus Neomarinimicrobiota bacterium]MBT4383261.1 T9SS type A sorting domain-containing protein [Candidatus Neomarinimicrobiota bacterium]MBT4636047.1 T9SS type A sorting domain-containing protein [Candidatus Neomarinimicrobiota bacterium]
MKKYTFAIVFISNIFAQVDYESQIQTIIDANCTTSCHTFGGGYQNNLDLTSYANLMAGTSVNGPVVIPLDHANSLLWQKVNSGQMPPQNYPDLTSDEVDLIAQWIDEGALETPTDVDCYADDGTDGVEIWGICYSIENTTSIGWPLSIPDSATYFPDELFSLVNLNTISINYSNISGPIPEEIGNFSNLTRLNLSSNQLSGEIPSEIGNLTELTSLDLSSNQLSGNIPTEIFSLINLKGEIEYVAGAGGGASILHQGLNLSNNFLIGTIQPEIGNLTNLKTLDLSFNELVGDLPTEVYSLDSLQSLNLSNNLITGEISDEIGNLLQLEGVTTYAHMSVTQYDALNLSNNLLGGLIPESICNLPLEWDNSNMQENQGFSISNNQFCGPFPSCVEPFIGIQDTSNCAPLTSPIEGRWIIPLFENDPGNTMYEFLDGLRYTYYCADDNGCDSTYWNSLDTSDAIPNPDPYTFSNDTLYMDSWQQPVTFECDGNVVSFGDTLYWSWWRVGFDISECEDQELGFSNITNTPEKFKLNQNYPNPFNPVTTFRYNLPEDSFVNITVYDMLGNVVSNLINQKETSGYKSVQWNATNDVGSPVSAGMYLYRIQAGEFTQTKKMVLLK